MIEVTTTNSVSHYSKQYYTPYGETVMRLCDGKIISEIEVTNDRRTNDSKVVKEEQTESIQIAKG